MYSNYSEVYYLLGFVVAFNPCFLLQVMMLPLTNIIYEGALVNGDNLSFLFPTIIEHLFRVHLSIGFWVLIIFV